MSQLDGVLKKVMQLTFITDGGVRAEPSAAGDHESILEARLPAAGQFL